MSGRKKFAKIIIFLSNNCHFTILSDRNAARFSARHKKHSLIFLSSLVRKKNVLLHFHAFRGKRERERTSIRMHKASCRRFVTGLDP